MRHEPGLSFFLWTLTKAGVPKEIKIKDKTVTEKLQLIEQLEDEDKQAVYRIIDGMLTKTKFKDFFQKNVAAM